MAAQNPIYSRRISLYAIKTTKSLAAIHAANIIHKDMALLN
jgi:hypothetical protein